jgi:cytochrome P450
MVFVSDPALIEGVLTAPSDVLLGDARIQAVVGKHSVIVLSGPPHTAARELLLPALRGDHIGRYAEMIERVCAKEVAEWPLGRPVELLPLLERITLGVIKSALFGTTGDGALDTLGVRFKELLGFRDKPISVARLNVMRPGSGPPKSLLKLREPFDAAVFAEIERARQDPRLDQRDDILATLLKARHDDGSALSDVEIRDHVTTLLIQGHEPTAVTLAWAFERLTRHPEILERLRAELEAGSEDYLDAVFKETLRVRPTEPLIVRMVAKPYRLREYELDLGTLIACNGFGMQLREDLYAEPHEFRPERFLEQDPGRYTWIAFGGGIRHCIGRTLATHEARYVLRTLVQKFRFTPAVQGDEGVRRRGILWLPEHGCRVVLQERLDSPAAA